MADYGITGVKYDSIGKHIEWVKVGEFTGSSFGIRENWLRTKVISEFEKGKTFITVLKHGDRLKKGLDISIVTVNGKKYIRTDNNDKNSDNLKDIPEFP
ncbi:MULTISPECIES: DUF3892 domain-containing protein [Methanobacterium]|uniref:DUF3892 domain-containing protein n=1 Tax=Methanobacterium bryantii TaxID=2161 RepID=A0A2A2H8F0_METBR|nr:MULTISPECIES: DUF3892 domain-containing protein [Methanobacterium]OEC86228.1 hypothetical protein A9507_11415 [Methanobacterium sp. A39]PAV05657.1 hypothetical protein ASJ80_07945 [Methanobacterium bryantii]